MPDLKLTVSMQAMDRMTAPFRKMLQSTERLRKGLSGTTGGFERLQKASEGMEYMRTVAERAEKVRGPFKRILHSSNALSASLTDTAGTVKNLEKTSENIDAFRSLRHTARQNENALQAAQDKTRTLALNMQNTEKVTRKMRSEFTAARRDVVRLKASKLDIIRSTDTLRATLRGAGVDTRHLGQAQVKLKADLDGARVAAERQAKSLEITQQHAQKAAQMQERFGRMQNVRTHMAIGGATAMATGGVGLFGLNRMMQAGIDFEHKMASVAATARIERSSEMFAKLEEQARELGKKTTVGAGNVAAAQKYMAMAGMEPEKILTSTEHVLNLSKAAEVDAGRASDILTNIMGGMELDFEKIEHAADTLALATTTANVDLEQLGETMKYVSPVAREYGLSLEETTAMAGLLGNIGIHGSQSGTALRALITNLTEKDGTAQRTLASLGIDVKDEKGDTRSLPLIFAELAKATEKMGSADRLGTFTKVAGKDAATALSKLVKDQGTSAITVFAEILAQQKGDAARIAKAKTDTTKGEIGAMNSAIEDFNISLMKLNAEPLRDIFKWATKAVERFDQWVENNPTFAGTLMKVAAGASLLATGLGGLATAAAGMLMPIVMARYAFLGLGLSMRMLPIVGLVSAIATGAYFIYENWESITAFLKKTWNTIYEFFQETGKNISAMWETFTNTFGEFGMLAAPLLGCVGVLAAGARLIYENWEPLTAFFEGLWKNALEVYENLKGMFGGLFGDDDDEKVTRRVTLQKITENAPRLVPTAKGMQAAAAASVVMASAAAPAPAAPPSVIEGSRYEINIQTGSNMDERRLAEKIREELEEREHQQRSTARSVLYDGVS